MPMDLPPNPKDAMTAVLFVSMWLLTLFLLVKAWWQTWLIWVSLVTS